MAKKKTKQGGARPGAGRKAGGTNGKPKKTAVLYVKCFPEQLEKYQTKAEEEETSLSEFVRSALDAWCDA